MKDYQYFIERRKRFFASLTNGDVAIVFAAEHQVRSKDVHYPFRQDNDFWYLTGCLETNAAAVFIKGEGIEKFWLFVEDRTSEQVLWDGAVTGPIAAKTKYHASETFAFEKFNDQIMGLFGDVDDNRKYKSQSAKEIVKAIKSRKGHYNLVDHASFIHSMRVIKDTLEIQNLREAVSISKDAHIKAMIMTNPGTYEYEIDALLTYEMQRQNAKISYPSIVAGGGNGCVLHYIANGDELQNGDLLLIDAGAEYENYASDITRTFPINGKFSKEQCSIYELVLKMQLKGISVIKPGVNWEHVQTVMVDILVEGLLMLGILAGDKESNIASKSYKDVYPHSSGHYLGLDVHDVGTYKIDGKYRTFESGMVLTVEPGIYIHPRLENLDSKWHNIAVRIEDDILVTDNGFEVLSAAIPKTVKDIEEICSRT